MERFMKSIKSFCLIVICFMMVGATAEISAVQITKKSKSEAISKAGKPKLKARYSFKKGAKNQKVLDMLAKN